MNKKFYLGPKFGTLFNKSWITISELLQMAKDITKTAMKQEGKKLSQKETYIATSHRQTR
jgi:hypothetical protein